jgi:hypothetical protein
VPAEEVETACARGAGHDGSDADNPNFGQEQEHTVPAHYFGDYSPGDSSPALAASKNVLDLKRI